MRTAAGAGAKAFCGFLAAALFLEKLLAELFDAVFDVRFDASLLEPLAALLFAELLLAELLNELLPFAAPGFLAAEVLPEEAGRLAVRVDFARG